ncbi:MAG: enoyl-CoA hydratase/isomerase family protein [Sphingobacteriales bacterium]|nr:enoyl-CoA hydratase/isomerase family protein [Sphingobacteriales bacterium]
MKKIKVNYSYDNSVVTIILDDGKGNVLDRIMMDELQYVFDAFTKKEELKLIVFEGNGTNFSYGASVEEHKKEHAAVMLRIFHQLFYSLRDISVPALAKVSGQCLGGGFELALMCNFIFADKSVKFGQPEIILGVFPPPASILLPEKIGYARAEELLITGKTISADEAKSMGLVNEVFENKDALDAGVKEWVGKNILPKSASSLRYSVRAARAKLNHVLSNFLPQLESIYLKELMETHDANEGIGSFLEKRKPVWTNN